MKQIDLENVKEPDFKRPNAGTYICKTLKVIDMSEKELLKIAFDIADGEFEGHFTNLFNEKGLQALTDVWSYKEAAQWFFKQRIQAIQESNPPYKFDGRDEKTLENKYIILELVDEDYTNKNGDTRTKLTVKNYIPLSSDDLKHMNEKAKQKGRLIPANDNDDLPFM